MTSHPYQPHLTTADDSLLPLTTQEALLPACPPHDDRRRWGRSGAGASRPSAQTALAVPFTLSRYLPTPPLSAVQRGPDD